MSHDGAKVKWTEPWAVSRRRTLDELRAAGVTWRTWARAAVVGAIVVLLLIVAMLVWMPGVVVPWPQVIAGLLLWPVVISAYAYVGALAPVFVTVSERRIQVSQGQGGVVVRPHDLLRVRLDDTSEPARLCIEYAGRKGKLKERWCALSPRVDRARLEEVLERLRAEAAAARKDGSLEPLEPVSTG